MALYTEITIISKPASCGQTATLRIWVTVLIRRQIQINKAIRIVAFNNI